MKAVMTIGLVPFLLAAPVAAQDHSMHNMPGMTMPAKPAAKPQKPAPKAKPAAKAPARPRPAKPAPRSAPVRAPAPAADPHAGHDMSKMPGMDGPAQRGAPSSDAAADPHAGHEMPAGSAAAEGSASSAEPAGTDLPPGNAPAPAPPPEANAADSFWGSAAMAEARETLRREHGGGTFSQLLFNLAEYQVRSGRDGYRWDGEAWIGGDINRLTLKSEGEGAFGRRVESAEVQALYSRAVDPYWNLQAGVRQDLGRGPRRTYATIGVEGLAPYWFETEAALFLSNKGDLLARIEGYYDQRLTQSLVLQPRAELNLAAQDIPENGIGAGLSDIELGLRLRYERTREFAPYLGVSWERALGDTADYARASGEDTGGFSFVMGVRTWF